QGLLSTNNPGSADARMYLRVNNLSTSYNSYIVFDGNGGEFGEYDSTSYYLGRTVFSRNTDIAGEYTLFTSGVNRIIGYGWAVISDYTGSEIRSVSRCAGKYDGVAGANVTEIDFGPATNGGFSGRLTVYANTP